MSISIDAKNIELKLWLYTAGSSQTHLFSFFHSHQTQRELQLKLSCEVNVPLRLGVTAPTGGRFCVCLCGYACVCIFGHRHEVSLAGTLRLGRPT